MGDLKIKVCGMRDPENIAGIAAAGPDFMGFIFYGKSSRYVGPLFEVDSLVPPSIKKAGVFVNEIPERVIETCQKVHLDIAQLHGNESPGYCRQIQQAGLTVFKAFAIGESFDFNILEEYRPCCHFFLFDTKGQLPGGTGHKFDWQLLNNYQLDIPFFLSGGIRPEDLNSIQQIHHPKLYGVDINSGFEVSPAVKDVSKVRQFIAGIKSKI
ncbi:MAG TPA: phosphoribosylanthranilate isomerase [Prolixibacteraceae bacterium]|nr:phosphoribosylanthranilate isomerase [Prolixibacteraceae bacterium]